MKNLNELNEFRIILKGLNTSGDDKCGSFVISSLLDGKPLCIIAANSRGWDHVSISRRDRCPVWSEMEFVKRLFFKEDELAMQLHLPPADHINWHPFVLHLWRPHNKKIPLPPKDMV